MGNTDLIGSAEACGILGGIDRATLVRRVAAGKLACAQKLPGQTGVYLFDRAEVLRHKAEIDAETDGRVAKAATA
jgi:hypothetical protein